MMDCRLWSELLTQQHLYVKSKAYTADCNDDEQFNNKKAQLTPWLVRDSGATWPLSFELDTAAAIEALTCAAT